MIELTGGDTVTFEDGETEVTIASGATVADVLKSFYQATKVELGSSFIIDGVVYDAAAETDYVIAEGNVSGISSVKEFFLGEGLEIDDSTPWLMK